MGRTSAHRVRCEITVTHEGKELDCWVTATVYPESPGEPLTMHGKGSPDEPMEVEIESILDSAGTDLCMNLDKSTLKDVVWAVIDSLN